MAGPIPSTLTALSAPHLGQDRRGRVPVEVYRRLAVPWVSGRRVECRHLAVTHSGPPPADCAGQEIRGARQRTEAGQHDHRFTRYGKRNDTPTTPLRDGPPTLHPGGPPAPCWTECGATGNKLCCPSLFPTGRGVPIVIVYQSPDCRRTVAASAITGVLSFAFCHHCYCCASGAAPCDPRSKPGRQSPASIDAMSSEYVLPEQWSESAVDETGQPLSKRWAGGGDWRPLTPSGADPSDALVCEAVQRGSGGDALGSA